MEQYSSVLKLNPNSRQSMREQPERKQRKQIEKTAGEQLEGNYRGNSWREQLERTARGNSWREQLKRTARENSWRTARQNS